MILGTCWTSFVFMSVLKSRCLLPKIAMFFLTAAPPSPVSLGAVVKKKSGQKWDMSHFPEGPPSPKVRHILGDIFYCIFELYSLCLAFRDQLIFFPPKMWKNLENFLELSLLEATSNLSKFRPPSLWWTKYLYVFITRFGAFGQSWQKPSLTARQTIPTIKHQKICQWGLFDNCAPPHSSELSTA